MSQSAEESRYLRNQARLQAARDAANPRGKEKRHTTVFAGRCIFNADMDVDQVRRVHNASPIYDTTYDHVRSARTSIESGIELPRSEEASWADQMETEYGELCNGQLDYLQEGFCDAAGYGDIAARGQETRRKLFGKPSGGTRAATPSLKPKAADEIESPWRDKKAYTTMRALMPVRQKDHLQREAGIWVEKAANIPYTIEASLDQLHLEAQNSPSGLSDSCITTPEGLDTDEVDLEDGKFDKNDFFGGFGCGFDSAPKKDATPVKTREPGKWVWRAKTDPTRGYTREKVWILDSDWS